MPRPAPVVTVPAADPPSRATAAPAIALAVAAALLALLAFGADIFRPEPLVETSLRHELGQPVDVVEQFVAALNYGQLDVAAGAVATGAARFELPFGSSPPDRISSTLATFRDTGAAIQMFGCEAAPSGGSSTLVSCSVAYVDDFVRELDSEYLRGTMDFVVEDDRIRGVVADLPLPAEGRYRAWLLDFYASRLPEAPAGGNGR